MHATIRRELNDPPCPERGFGLQFARNLDPLWCHTIRFTSGYELKMKETLPFIVLSFSFCFRAYDQKGFPKSTRWDVPRWWRWWACCRRPFRRAEMSSRWSLLKPKYERLVLLVISVQRELLKLLAENYYSQIFFSNKKGVSCRHVVLVH